MVKLRLGIVGLGDEWETRYKPALRALADRFEVRAICSSVAARAEQGAREFGASAVDGFRALAEREDVDAVLVLSPEWYGLLPVLAACDAGKAVYCAAPLDVDLERAAEVKRRVEASGVAFMAELARRQAPATLRLKELIATGLDQPQLLFCHERLRASAGGKGRRRGQPSPSTSRHLIELVDWCRYVVDADPVSVMGVRHYAADPAGDGPGRLDYQMMSLDFSPAERPGRGVLAQISCGSYLRANWPEAVGFRPPAQLQVCCRRGVAFVDLPATLVWFDDAGRHVESLENERPVGERLLAQFHRSVTSLVRNTRDLEDAYRAVEIVLAAKTSWEQGRRVSLESRS